MAAPLLKKNVFLLALWCLSLFWGNIDNNKNHAVAGYNQRFAQRPKEIWGIL